MKNELVLAVLSAMTGHTATNKLCNFLIKPPQTETDLPPTLQAASHPRVSSLQEESLVNNKEFSRIQIAALTFHASKVAWLLPSLHFSEQPQHPTVH